MNWFFHKVYWGGWIGLHNRKKKDLLSKADDSRNIGKTLDLGLGLLGFASLYREGFEVVLFLQGYYLQMGGCDRLGRGVARDSFIGFSWRCSRLWRIADCPTENCWFPRV